MKNEEQIKLYAKHDLDRMKDMDAYIGVRANQNDGRFVLPELEALNPENLI